MKIFMTPSPGSVAKGESGIHTLIRKYATVFPQFGMEIVSTPDDADVQADHAGTSDRVVPGLPFVAHTHGLYWSGMYNSQAWEFAANANVINSVRHAHEITVPSSWVGEVFQRDMHRNPTVIPHGVDWDSWQHNEQKERYVVGYAKNRSGQDVCSPAYLNPLASAFPNIKFIATFAPESPAPNIQATGVLPYEEMKRLVQRGRVFVSCTRETFGIAILEAMAAGLPILGWAEGGIVDLVKHGVNGYLARPNDYVDLAQGLDYCIKNRMILGTNGRELAKVWTWENAVEKLKTVYENAIWKANSPPTCAIIIPSYKYADKVGYAVASAVRQTYRFLTDIIVVDDCTPDEGATERSVNALAEKDFRIRYARLPQNSGVAVARNYGIELAETKYIACLDSDDALHPQFLEACIPALEKDRSLGISYTGLEMVTQDGQIWDTLWPPDFPDFNQQIAGKNQVPTACVFRREIWENLLGYRSRYAPNGCGSEDAELWTRIGANGWGSVKASTARLFTYRLGGNTTGDRKYKEPNWLEWHPWTKDKIHPFASLATPARQSHPVRIYDSPTVSVVIPVGPGHEGDVVNALDSLEAQDLRNWEAVVVLDHINEELISPVLKAFPYIRVFRTNETKGAGAARNLGAKNARASLLVFLDADDYLLPTALSTMIFEFGRGEGIIYGDCRADAVIDDLSKLDPAMRDNVLEYNPKNHKAVIRFPASNYNCELAQQQPMSDNPDELYLVAHVTCLIPKRWHDAIGGFDEAMKSWEDVDWHWRLAKAGYCYRRVDHTDFFVYQLGSGGRREIGRKNWKSLLRYIKDKHKEIKPMPCNSCGQSSNPPSIKRIEPQTGQEITTMINDEELIECEYTSPNRGQHSVTGAVTRTRYGYRSGGDRFLVHKSDVQAQPMFFRPVNLEAVTAARPEVYLPPPPMAMSNAVPLPEENLPSEPELESIPSAILEGATKSASNPESAPAPVGDLLAEAQYEKRGLVDENAIINLDVVTGITPAIADQMKAAGLTSPRSIMDSGIEGLQSFKGVGP